MIYKPQHMQKHHRTLLFMIIGFLIAIVIGISVWFLRKPTVTTPHAAASTVLSLTSQSQSVNVGQPISADITADPGTNQISLIKLRITYDGSKLQANTPPMTANAGAFPTTLEPPTASCNGTQCTISATFSIGADPTKAIQTKTTVATLNLKAIAGTNGTATQLAFDSSTSVYSVASGDLASENVLSSTNPLAISIGGTNSCQPNQSTCSWDSVSSATTYHYKVVDSDGNIIQEGDANAPQTSISFASQPGKTYTCSVSATNVCGKSSAGSGTSTCPVLSTTPTPSICSGPGTVKNLHIICPNCNTQ